MELTITEIDQVFQDWWNSDRVPSMSDGKIPGGEEERRCRAAFDCGYNATDQGELRDALKKALALISTAGAYIGGGPLAKRLQDFVVEQC